MKRLLLALFVLPIVINTLNAQTAVAPTGAGTSGDAYQIATLNNLYWVTQNSSSWGAYFEQTADIDASTSSGWDGGSGFLPIGSSGTNFSGNYDGQGYAIDGLTINRSGTFGVGLFGYTDGATIANLGVTGLNITGNGYVGGFVGYAENSNISDCYTTGTVVGNSFGVGGFVGINDGTTTISTCYSTCNTSSSGNQQVGGFVGRNRFYADGSTIQDCYSRGSADSDGTAYGGGFAGINNSGGTIINCYCTGAVDARDGGGSTNEVGFSGGNSGTITDCFWDTQTSGITDSNGGTGKTTSEMKDYNTFTDQATVGLTTAWDFALNPNDDSANNDYWEIDGATNDGYPFLYFENGVTQSLPVELTSFELENTVDGVLCSWTTESEFENLGFAIERRTQDEEWREIVSYKNDNKLIGQGTTSIPTNYTYTDKLAEPNTKYDYRLLDIDYNGKVTKHTKESITTSRSQLSSKLDQFTVLPAYPNPFNPSTTITYGLNENSNVSITIYDLSGHLITTLLNKEQPQGWHTIEWNGTDMHNNQVPAGIYLSRITSNNTTKTSKLMLLK